MRTKQNCAVVILAALTCLAPPCPSIAANFLSFTGSFTQDNDVHLIDFSITETTNVAFRSWSYAGGTNAVGQVIPSGWFDPILTVFDSNGNWLAENDDGGFNVPVDPATGDGFDSLFGLTLTPGTYKVALTQYDNFSLTFLLNDGFDRDGQGNFTGTLFGNSGESFIQIGRNQRTNQWAFDILLPEPATLSAIVFGFVGLGLTRRTRSKSVA